MKARGGRGRHTTAGARRRGRDRDAFTFGVVSLLVLAVLVYLGFTKSIPFRSHYELEATFASVATQLKKNSPVRIAGVNVGKVTSVRRGPGTTVRVRMRIDERGRPIHKNATMKIRPRLFLEGNFFVDVKPGTGEAPELGDGDAIPITQTAIPVQFDQLLATFDADARDDTQVFIDELGKGVAGRGATSLNAAFHDAPSGLVGLARTMSAARGVEPHDLSRFLANTSALSQALTVDKPGLQRFLSGLNGTFDAFGGDGRGEQLGRTLDELDVVLADAPQLARDAVAVEAPVRRLTAALQEPLGRIPRALGPTAQLLRDARPLLANDQLPSLARNLGPALDDLRAQIPALNALFDRTEDVAVCVRDNVVPILNSSVDDGHLSTGLKVWEELVRFPVSLALNSANFNGNGNNLRLGLEPSAFSLATTNPQLGALLTGGSQPILGARPQWSPDDPPFRPDVSCRTQPRPSLEATTAKPPSAARRVAWPKPTKANLEKVMDAVRRLSARDRRAAIRRAGTR